MNAPQGAAALLLKLQQMEQAINELKDAQAAAYLAIIALGRTHPNRAAAVATYDGLVADFQTNMIASGAMSGLPAFSRMAFQAMRENLLFGTEPPGA